MSTRGVAVIGAGRMGLAIAHLFATRRYDVVLVEPNAAVAATADERYRSISRTRGIDRDTLPALRIVADIAALPPDAAIVVEAAVEDVALKQRIFAELDRHFPAPAILATNTSAIPIRLVAGATSRPERVVGTHFWNPPYAVRLVEVVQAETTSAETVERTLEIMRDIGQTPVHVKRDIPGFIGNRLQHALKREAIALVQNGVCDAETVDLVVKQGFGARLGVMGPLEQSDLVGLDLTLAIHSELLADLDASPAPQPLLKALIAAGKTGVKTGAGFRTWTAAGRAELEARLDLFLRDAARRQHVDGEGR